MVVEHLEKAKIQTIINGDADISADSISTIVTLRENAIDDAVIIANDEKGKTYLGNVNLDDEVVVKFKWEDGDDTWHEVFKGKVVELQPDLNIQGEICAVRAYGYGVCLKRMRVGMEYGSESERPTMDTLREILTNFTYGGIIPFWVEKYHNSAGGLSNSGYTLNTDYIWDYDGQFKYLHFPYESAYDALKDIINLISAMRYPASGVHWIVTPDKKLIIAPIGDHNVEGKDGEHIIEDVWATYASDEALEVTKQMIETQFTKKEREANYIVVCGNFQRPMNGDDWTEEDATNWEHEQAEGDVEDNGNAKVGSYCINMEGWESLTTYRFRRSVGASFYCSDIGSKKNVSSIGFWYKRGGWTGSEKVILYQGSWDKRFELDVSSRLSENNWIYVEVEFGPYSDTEWTPQGGASWDDTITHIGFSFYTETHLYEEDAWVDGLTINGTIIRGAYHSGNITAHGCKQKLITDSLAKADNVDVSDDSSQLAQFAKAELLRAMTTPLTGTIQIPLDPTIMAGQLIHIHASRTTVGFNIDQDMRIIQVRHTFTIAGAFTHLTLTDDVTNSIPIGMVDAYNAIVKASNPDFQDRDRASMKGKDIDIGQEILAKDYT